MLMLLVERTDSMACPPIAGRDEIGSEAIRLEDAMSMSIDSILRQKGADVATIAPEASVKRATSWLHERNIAQTTR